MERRRWRNSTERTSRSWMVWWSARRRSWAGCSQTLRSCRRKTGASRLLWTTLISKQTNLISLLLWGFQCCFFFFKLWLPSIYNMTNSVQILNSHCTGKDLHMLTRAIRVHSSMLFSFCKVFSLPMFPLILFPHWHIYTVKTQILAKSQKLICVSQAD